VLFGSGGGDGGVSGDAERAPDDDDEVSSLRSSREGLSTTARATVLTDRVAERVGDTNPVVANLLVDWRRRVRPAVATNVGRVRIDELPPEGAYGRASGDARANRKSCDRT